MDQKKFNIVVIGAGAAGLVSSYIAAAVKAKVALIEKNQMGGDCLNTGCVPSKAIIKSAKFLHSLKNPKKYGVKSVDYEFEFSDIMDRVHQVIAKIEPHDSVERYSSLGVECFQGEAEILDKFTVKVGDDILKTDNIIIATGASPFIPDILELDTIDYLTSENLWEIRDCPKRLIVLGGGPIGCEMAQAFQRLGASVTLIEMAPRIMPRNDPEISEFMNQRFRKEGVKVKTSARATKVKQNNNQKSLVVVTDNDIEEEIEFDQILVAVGRQANTQQFDLEKLGIKLNANQTLKVDNFLRVNGHNMFACGDVAGPYQFTHVAAHQAWYAAVNALFRPLNQLPFLRKSLFSVDYSVIPWVTFTDPEVAHVGISELEAKAQNIPYEVVTYGLDDLDRAIAESEDLGFVKVITPPGKDKILGATIVGCMAGEMITEFVNGMKHGFGLNGILGTIHSYPTFSEGNKFAAGNWKKAHAPGKALQWLERFFAFRRR